MERPVPAEVAGTAPESSVTSEPTGESVPATAHTATTASATTPAASPSACGDGERRKDKSCQQDESDREDEGLLRHVFLSNEALRRVCAPFRASVKPAPVDSIPKSG